MSSYEPLPSSPVSGGHPPSIPPPRPTWRRPSRTALVSVSVLTIISIFALASTDVQQQEIRTKVGGLVSGGVELAGSAAGSAKDWWTGPLAPSVYGDDSIMSGALLEEDELAEGRLPTSAPTAEAADVTGGRTPDAPTPDSNDAGDVFGEDVSTTLDPDSSDPASTTYDLATALDPDAPELAPPSEELLSTMDPGTPESELEEVECTEELIASLSLASFWVGRKTSSLHYEITSRDPIISSPGDCLDNAVFSARLVSPANRVDSETGADRIIASLPAPTLSEYAGVYVLAISSDLVIPHDQYQVEIRLSFGSLPGATEGDACAGDGATCTAAGLPNNQKYVGEKIEMAPGSRVSLGQDETAFGEEGCSSLSPLTGYWKGKSFHPADPSSGVPCHLQTPAFPTPFTARGPMWINLIGDSNPRNLYSALVKSLGIGSKLEFFTMESKVKNGTVAAIALRSRSGLYDPHESADPDIIVTWQWWHATAHKFDDNAAELAWWTNGTLAEFLSRAQLKGVLSSHRGFQQDAATLLPTRTYISLGSHSEDLTAIGTGELLDVLFSEQYVSQELRESANVRVFTTTRVQPSLIPLDRFARQDLVRNNAVIHAKNDVLRARPELEGRVVDAEGLTAGITEDFMKQSGKPDAVHFIPAVYEAWANLVWSELMMDGPV